MTRRFWSIYAVVLALVLPGGATIIWSSFADARSPAIPVRGLPRMDLGFLNGAAGSGAQVVEGTATDDYAGVDELPGLPTSQSAGPTPMEPSPDPARSPAQDSAPVPPTIAGANYPSSTLITRITWGRSMRREGCGDNLPVTWGADGHLYTAFGDCTGFGGQRATTTVARLSDTGDPLEFAGRNVWQLDGGVGPAGKKISGLISIRGVLYALFRNADGDGHEFQVGYSKDGGSRWQLASWRLRWGYPTFVNFGKDSRGAPDGNVYIVSPDTSDAYAPSSDPAHRGMILMRVAAGRLLDRSAYTYYKGFWRGRAHWSVRAGVRKLVFSCAQTACLRGQISYDAPLGRYLWWQQIFVSSPDTRWEGGFALYEGPNLWGPWRTVYFTANAAADPAFHDGPGEGGSFPTKWMSRDGRRLYFVCSCQNTFTVRRVILTTR